MFICRYKHVFVWTKCLDTDSGPILLHVISHGSLLLFLRFITASVQPTLIWGLPLWVAGTKLFVIQTSSLEAICCNLFPLIWYTIWLRGAYLTFYTVQLFSAYLLLSQFKPWLAQLPHLLQLRESQQKLCSKPGELFFETHLYVWFLCFEFFSYILVWRWKYTRIPLR